MTYEESEKMTEALEIATSADATPADVKRGRAMAEALGPEALSAFNRTVGEGTEGLVYESVPGGFQATNRGDPDYDSFDYYDEDVADAKVMPEEFKQRLTLAQLQAIRRKR